MAHAYTGGSAVRNTHTILDDGDAASAARFNGPYQSLIDQTAWLLRTLIANYQGVAIGAGAVGEYVLDVAAGKDSSGVECFVAIADEPSTANHLRAISYDGVRWSAAQLAFSARMRGVAFDDGLDVWVIVGENSGGDALILSATDPAGTWTERGNPQDAALHAVAASGSSLFVAVGESDGSDGYIVSSTDGSTWTERSATVNYALYDVIFANSLWVAVGGSGSTAIILTSPDGTTWTSRSNSGTEIIRAVAWNGNVFVTLGDDGQVMTSSNGTTWTVRTGLTTGTSGVPAALAADPTYGVIVCHGSAIEGLQVSFDDGVTFSNIARVGRQAGLAQLTPWALRFCNGRFVLCGNYCELAVSLRR